jgi:hypothetical protein
VSTEPHLRARGMDGCHWWLREFMDMSPGRSMNKCLAKSNKSPD